MIHPPESTATAATRNRPRPPRRAHCHVEETPLGSDLSLEAPLGLHGATSTSTKKRESSLPGGTLGLRDTGVTPLP